MCYGCVGSEYKVADVLCLWLCSVGATRSANATVRFYCRHYLLNVNGPTSVIRYGSIRLAALEPPTWCHSPDSTLKSAALFSRPLQSKVTERVAKISAQLVIGIW